MAKIANRAFMFGSAAVLALGLVAVPLQLDSEGFRIDSAAAAGKGGGYKNDCPPLKGNNGWGNGGGDGINPGSDDGAGVSSGGFGAGQSQQTTKTADADR